VELTPGVVTILPAWKLDAVYCVGLKVGAPQVSLSALCALHELLVACESRLISSDGSTVAQEAHDGIAGKAHAEDGACSGPASRTRTAPIQLDLVLDDVRLRGMTPAERQTVLRTFARLLLEAGGAITREADDDRA
jgi:hypothetical protein